MTTAAAVWSTAALGVAVGVGRYVLGLSVLLMPPLVTVALGRENHEGPKTEGLS